MSSQPLRVLVAEDNPALLRIEEYTLSLAGFEVTAVENGLLAWQAATSRHYDVVVTDYQMPQMSGADLCRQLRTLPEYASTPFIMLTAFGLELNLPCLQEEIGLAAILAKPFSPSRLLAVIREHFAPVA